jgi:hypothetical protein
MTNMIGIINYQVFDGMPDSQRHKEGENGSQREGVGRLQFNHSVLISQSGLELADGPDGRDEPMSAPSTALRLTQMT